MTSTRTAERHRASRPGHLRSVVALCLLIAACGSDDDGDADRTSTSTAVSAEEPTSTDVASTEPAGGTSTADTAVTTSAVLGRPAVEPTATIPLGTHVDSGLVTDDAVWAVVNETDMLYRIDPDTNSVVQEVSVPGIGVHFDIGHGAAWVTDFDGSIVRRVELEGGTVVAEIPVGESPEGISITDDAVWVANHHAGTVTRIDPATNTVVATIEVGPVGPAGPQPIVASAERVWVGVPNLAQVVVIDATTNAVISTIESDATCGMKILDESVWVTNCFESDDVAVIDEAGDTARGMQAGGPAGTPMYIDGDVWLPTISLSETVGRLLRVDPATLEVLDSVVTDPPAFSVGYGFDSVWEFSWDAGAVVRLPVDALVHPPE